MPLRERPAFDILPRKPHAIAVIEREREGQRLACRPVNAFARINRLATVVEEPQNCFVRVKIRRNIGQFAADFLSKAVDAPVSPRRASSCVLATAFMPAQRPSSQSALFGL